MTLTYDDVVTFVQNLAPTWVKPQQAMLAYILCALAERPSLCSTELARELPDGPHAQIEQSLHGRLKRLNRFLDNPRLDEPEIFLRCYRLAVHFSADVPDAPELLPILLDTTYFQPFAALIASIPCGGRGLPILFTTYHRRKLQACFPPVDRWPDSEATIARPARRKHQPLQAASAQVHHWASQNHIEEQLLNYLWSFVNPMQRIVIVADRGFARASLFRWFLNQERQFVIRFDGDTWLYLPDGQRGATQQVVAIRPGERCWIPQAAYGQEDKVPVAVLAVWDVGQKQPWYLATNLRNCLKRSTMGKATQHQADHDDVDHRFTGRFLDFIILAQPPMMIEPGEGALNNPAPGQDGEPFLLLWTEHHSQVETKVPIDPVEQLTAVATVHPDQAELLACPTQARQEQPCAITILHGCRRDHDRHQKTKRIHQQVTLTPLDQLGFVEATFTRHSCGFDALAIQATSSGMLVPASSPTHLGPQRVMDASPRAATLPVPKVAVHALPLRVLPGQHPPLDAAHDYIQDRIDDQPHIQASGPSARFGQWDQILDNDPLAVGQVGWV